MLLPSDIIINSGRTLNGRDVNFVIRKEGSRDSVIFIYSDALRDDEPGYVSSKWISLGYLEFEVFESVNPTLAIKNFIMNPWIYDSQTEDTVSKKQDKIKLFKGLGRLMLCCVTHFLLTKKEVSVESPVVWYIADSDVSADYARLKKNGDLKTDNMLPMYGKRWKVSKNKQLEEVWKKFGFQKNEDQVRHGWLDNYMVKHEIRSTVRDIQLNCIKEFERETAFGRDNISAGRYATIASLARLREELYARQAKRAKKGGEWEDDYEEEEVEGDLKGRRAFDMIHSDDLWRHILEFV